MRRLIILSNIKFNMKQAFNILLLVCFLMGVAACGQKSEKEQPEQKEDTTAKKLSSGLKVIQSIILILPASLCTFTSWVIRS